MKSEHSIQDEIRLRICQECPEARCFRTNAGKVYAGEKVWSSYHGGYILKNPRPVSLLPKGFPDLIVLSPKARLTFIEVKNDTGRASEDQKRFHAILKKLGFRVCIARSANEAVEFVNNGGNNDD